MFVSSCYCLLTMIIVDFTAHFPYGSLMSYLESSSALLREFQILHLLTVLIVFFFLSFFLYCRQDAILPYIKWPKAEILDTRMFVKMH